MEIKPIKNKENHQSSKRLEVILTLKGSSERRQLEVLGILIDQYENERFL
jgi:hypothetical protein